MKKKTMILLSALALTTAAHAEGYDYLAFQRTDGTAQTLKAVGLELTFSDGKLIATNTQTSEQVTMALADLASMFFTDTQVTTAVSAAKQTQEWGLAEAEAIYDLAGREVKPAHLRAGVYIIKKGNETRKISLK